ncbi:hypothetical protein BDN72DRAFT_834147 [Pluteus cervinus]|uniref:Uncharacterized protein n=1 Tax=Pluteus cervinus TaxID=181527 RepID=A0ACD3B893_9AGAR|nr:hypothetical protein BDN72DRAFT_834147 [Pluteus cervinus]
MTRTKGAPNRTTSRFPEDEYLSLTGSDSDGDLRFRTTPQLVQQRKGTALTGSRVQPTRISSTGSGRRKTIPHPVQGLAPSESEQDTNTQKSARQLRRKRRKVSKAVNCAESSSDDPSIPGPGLEVENSGLPSVEPEKQQSKSVSPVRSMTVPSPPPTLPPPPRPTTVFLGAGTPGHDVVPTSSNLSALVGRRPIPLPLPSRVQPLPSISDSRLVVTNTPSSPPPLNRNHHPVHWYQDGNLWIELDGVHFKLHWSLMANQSTFFRERYESWRTDARKKGLMTGEEVVNLDGKGITAGDFAELLALTHFSRNSHEDSPTRVISILSASHALSFNGPYDWAKERFIQLWTIGEDFANLSTITTYSPNDAKNAFALSRTCEISDALKSALYRLMCLQSSDFKDGERQDWERDMGIDLLQCHERLSTHWATTISRLRLPPCSTPPISTDITGPTSSKPICASQDAIRSDIIHFRLLSKSGFYERFRNNPLMGLHTLKSQLIPYKPTTANTSRKRKRGEKEVDLAQDDSKDAKPEISPWADTQNGGGYCDNCLLNMRDKCADEMDVCWEKLEEWAGLNVEALEEDNDGLEYS